MSPARARPSLTNKMREIIMAGMELDSPPYARDWEQMVAELDPPVVKHILTIAYLLVTYPNAAPVPPPSYREMFIWVFYWN